MVFILVAPAIAYSIALAIEKILNVYDTILKIRIHHNELKDLGFTKKDLKGLQDRADNLMKSEIEKLVKKQLEEHYKSSDQNRRNELEADLTFNLNKIASRIDRGYSFEVRVQPIPGDADPAKEADPQDRKHIENIQAISKKIEFLKLEGDPILTLPESKEESDDEK